MTLADIHVDGRALRSSRTRAAIVTSHRRLLEQGDLSPTTSRVAEAAGVSQRTLFLHFTELENLFAATADSVIADVMDRSRPVDPSLPLPDRLDAFLTNRIDLYEFLQPFVLALRIREPSSAELRVRRAVLMAASRAELTTAFARELGLSQDPEDALLSLETCLSWPSWFHLHAELSMPRAVVHRVLRRSALRLVAP